MKCQGKECKCNNITEEKLITQYIDIQHIICYNEKCIGSIKNIFREFNRRDEEYLTLPKKKPFYLLIKIPFICRVNLTSILIRTSFQKMRLYKNRDLEFEDIIEKRHDGEYNLPIDLHYLNIQIRGGMRDVSVLHILLMGDEKSELNYCGIKGCLSESIQGPIITVYEARSSDSLRIERTKQIYN
ncbi:PITH domain-containing protein P35G2.02 [Astathelohania contejeani]|uniref:PITH domain-containing protein P35G2.02 n=1 Tax=Astathelohania contejeani TaxID=164912 RepID=A0ABQ7I2Q8_9MICR|nr:PITH domain-containing protein P35G2.02 [Thelohania contejeani]